MWEAGELWAHRQPNCVKSHFPHSVFIDSTLNLLPIHKAASIGSDKLLGLESLERKKVSFFIERPVGCRGRNQIELLIDFGIY